MNSSGIKRGLAYSAITALAVTGVPFLATPASATPIQADYAGSVGGGVTTADYKIINPDATPNPSYVTTAPYRIVVAGNDDVVAVQIRFDPAGADPEVVVANRVERVNGAFSATWTPTGPGDLNVYAFDLAGDLAPGVVQTQTVAVTLPSSSDTATIGGDTNVGVWNTKAAPGADAFTVGVTGTTSLTDTTASAADDGFRVQIEARTGSTGTAFADVTGNASGAFAGVLPLTSYIFTPGGPDQLVIGAIPQDAVAGVDGVRTNIEDAVVKTLYLQQLGAVTATAANNNLAPGDFTPVTVTATDTMSKPIAGANVYRSVNGAGATLEGTTDANGQFIDIGSGAGLGNGSYKYFVNAPAGAVANPQVTEETALGDKSATVNLAVYTPALTTIPVKAVYGSVSDIDEVNSGTPFIAKAVDQNGNGMGLEQLHYTWTVDPFDPAAPTRTSKEIPAATTTDNSGTDKGEVALRMATTGDFDPALSPLPDGTWTLKVYRKPIGGNGAFNATPVDFKFGESKVAFNPSDAQASQGGSTTIAGTLQLDDGSALGSIDRALTDPLGDVDRTATLAYVVGTEDNPATPAPLDGGAGDSRLAPISEQDGTVTSVAVGGATGAVKFNAAGVANIKVNDANPETQEEIDADLTATTSVALGADGTSNVEIDFLTTVVADKVVLDDTDALTLGAAPGRPLRVEFKVTNASGQTLSNKDVAITVADGAFVTDDWAVLPADPTLTPAQTNGTWANKGTTATVKTDGNGIATVTVAIEKNSGFDDDFRHDVDVTATVDGKSVSTTQSFFAKDAVDLDRVEVTPAEDNTANLPDAQVQFETVDFDVVAYDQFGNRSDETYTVDDAGNPRADVDTSAVGPSTTGTTQGTLDPADLTASATSATSQNITVTVPDRNGAAPDATVSDAADAINWYVVDFADSQFTLQQQGAESVPAGTRVTEVLTVLDQKDHAVKGLNVKFIRSGPSDEDSDLNGSDVTDETGRAYYDFTGGSKGVARISAIVTAGTTRVGTADDTVRFTGVITPDPGGTLIKIEAKLGGRTSGEFDSLRVSAPAKAAGAVVRLYKVVNGRRIQVGNTRGLNAKGNLIFKVVDRNGKARTKYVAVVKKTALTRSDTTNPKSLR